MTDRHRFAKTHGMYGQFRREYQCWQDMKRTDLQLPGHAMLFQGVPHYTADQMREYSRARERGRSRQTRPHGDLSEP